MTPDIGRPQVKDLWYVVNSVKSDLEIDSNKRDLFFLKQAVDGYKDLALANVMRGSIMTERLDIIEDQVTKEKHINMPSGYTGYNKVSLCYRGYIVNLTANDNICIAPPKLNCCGQELADDIDNQCNTWDNDPNGFIRNSAYYWDYFPYWKNGQFVAGMYGKGESNYVGGFKEDWQNRRIVFDRFLHHKEVILEYNTNGITDKGNAIVPNGYEDALIAFVHWKRCLFSKDPFEHRDYEQHRRRYQRQVKRLVARAMAMTIVEILDIYRAGIYQSPKR